MPNFEVAAYGESVANMDGVTRVIVFSMDMEGESQANVGRIGETVSPRTSTEGDSLVTVTRLRPMPLIVVADGDSMVIAELDPEPVAPLGFIVEVEGDSETFLTGTRVAFVVVVEGEGGIEGNLRPFFPVIREPAPGEVRGTVNFVRNSSLVLSQYGATDWDATAGVTVTRSAEQAFHGTHSGKFVFDTTTTDQGFSIHSAPGLGLTKDEIRSVVGSLYVRGSLLGADLRTHVSYTDASTGLTISDVFDIDTAGEWVRLVAPVHDLDITKTVSSFSISIFKPGAAPGAVSTLYVDAVQIEDAAGGTASPYALGDMGEGHMWLGVPNFSPSLRETR